ncbi:hypothetical protein PV703_31130 [Streptomyces sp. ME01-24h]|nr:hypothetical protein [Streptomyces sp. ME19-03-3]MDX3357671.1 hypothetical protein [Streptomyces sp. ME01-24h]
MRGLTTGSGAVAGPVMWSPLWAAAIEVVFCPLVERACRART